MEKSALAVGLRLMAVLSLLVTVTVFDAEWPTATVPKFKLAGLNESGVTPVPVSVTSCGLVAAPSLKVSAPVTAPAILGIESHVDGATAVGGERTGTVVGLGKISAGRDRGDAEGARSRNW
jgi:hypothetical protein